MAQFPKSEQGIVELAEKMINGLTEYPDDFPSCAPEGITSMLSDYKNNRDSVDNAQANIKNALETKDTSLEVLTTTIKDTLKKAEGDVAAEPTKLYEIGWGPRQQPQPVPVPGCPTDLKVIAEGQGMITLEWTRPAAGGPVRSYVVQRCQAVQTGGYGPWTTAGTCYNCEIVLSNQPMDGKMMYNVIAVNNSGESAPSNGVVVSLP